MTTKHDINKNSPINESKMPPNPHHLSRNDESFIQLAAVVLDQPEESIIKSLLKRGGPQSSATGSGK